MASTTGQKSDTKVFILRLILILSVIVIWELLGQFKLIDTFFFGQPSAIAMDIKEAFATGEILPHIKITLLEALAGLLLGTVVGIISAFILGKLDVTAKILGPHYHGLLRHSQTGLGTDFHFVVRVGHAIQNFSGRAHGFLSGLFQCVRGF